MGVAITEILLKKEIDIDFLKGRTLVVDSPMWLYQFLSSIRQRDGSLLTDSKGNVTSHLMGLISRVSNLAQQDIKLAFVFDGKPHKLKLMTLEKRKEIKQEAEKKLEEEKKKDLVAEENERRRKVHAQYIEGRAKTTTMAMGGVGAIAGGILAGPAVAIAGGIAGAGLYRGAYSHTQAKRSAEKIRTTKIKDLEEKEKEEKDATKIIMKILEKEKKVEEKPKAETEGGDKH